MRATAQQSYRGITRVLDGALTHVEWFGSPTQSDNKSVVSM